MVHRCQELAKEITQRLNLLADQIRTQTKAGFTDDNKGLEGLMARFFNAAFGWDLINLNVRHPNYPAADLGDLERRLAFQITSTPDNRKITSTSEKAVKHHLHLDFDTLILFFLLPEKPTNPSAFVQPSTEIQIRTLDLSELLTLLAEGPELQALQAANRVLDQRLGSIGRSTIGQSDPIDLPKPATRFFGRQKELQALLPQFTAHPRLAITGDGGSGKTALSAQLLEAYRATPEGQQQTAHGLYAHNFYQLPGWESFLSGILAHAGQDSKDPASDRARAATLLRQPGILLYIEGAEKLPSLEPLLDLIGPTTALLFTTRHTVPPHQLPSLPIGPLEEPDAIELLHFHAKNYPRRMDQKLWAYEVEDPGWSPLAKDLGRHPLACRLAGTYCGMHHKAPSAFHQQLKDQGLAPLSHGQTSKENLDLLWKSAALSLQKESPGEPSPALTAWHCLTLGGTNPTPLSVLQAFGANDEHALTLLLNHGLAEASQVPAATEGETEPAYALTHALLSDWARDGLTAFHRPPSALLESAMTWGKALFDEVADHQRVSGGELRYRILVPLAESLLAAIHFGPPLPPEQLDTFYYLPAFMHFDHGQYNNAEPHFRNVLAVMEQSAGALSPGTATALNNLAQLLHDTSRFTEAEPLMRRALVIDEANFGPDHPNFAIRLSNLAALLKDTNRMSEAEPLMRRALAVNKASFGADHPEVAADLNNLAQLLKATNRLAEAEPLMRRALAINEASFDPDHPEVAADLNNLAQLLQSTNRLEEAEPLMRRSLAINEASFGPDHPKVSIRLNNLARLLLATNRPDEAERFMRRALAIDESCFSPGHPKVASDLNNLAHLLKATNRMEEAEPLMRRALAINEASFGPNHPKVAISLNNLALLLKVTNRLPEAEPLIRRMVVIFLRSTASTGHTHPDLHVVLQNYLRLGAALEVSNDEFWQRIREIGDEAGIPRKQLRALVKKEVSQLLDDEPEA